MTGAQRGLKVQGKPKPSKFHLLMPVSLEKRALSRCSISTQKLEGQYGATKRRQTSFDYDAYLDAHILYLDSH